MAQQAAASINVALDTAPLQALINELTLARFWTPSQIQESLYWEWAQGYRKGYLDGSAGKPEDQHTDNPHKKVEP